MMLFRLDYSIDTKSASRLCYNVGQAPEGGHIGSSSPRRGSFWFQTPEGGDIAHFPQRGGTVFTYQKAPGSISEAGEAWHRV